MGRASRLVAVGSKRRIRSIATEGKSEKGLSATTARKRGSRGRESSKIEAPRDSPIP